MTARVAKIALHTCLLLLLCAASGGCGRPPFPPTELPPELVSPDTQGFPLLFQSKVTVYASPLAVILFAVAWLAIGAVVGVFGTVIWQRRRARASGATERTEDHSTM